MDSESAVGDAARMADKDERAISLAPPVAPDALTNDGSALSGFLDRDVFDSCLDQGLHRQWRTPTSVALLLVRLAELPVVAASWGHEGGDEVLGVVGSRLRDCLREVDTVARFTDDTFAVLLECDRRVAEPEVMASEVAHRLANAFRAPLSTSRGEVSVGCHLGIAVSGPAILHAEELVHRAEFALTLAGDRPGPSFHFFEDGQQTSALRRLGLKADLARAVERKQLSLRYQPLVALHGGAIVGMEALLRWHHPDRGAIAPAEFIPLAEATDLIVPIGTWVLEEAARQHADWSTSIAGLPVLGLSVNISTRQLCRPGLVEIVREAIDQYTLRPEGLLLELTESALMADDDVATAQLSALRDLGVRIALDDLGTGYSSLEYLSRLPVDVLKIAQVFIDQLDTSERANSLVRAIIDLAHSLGLITVAEGVEHREQADRLRQFGCYIGQGWHFARELEPTVAGEVLRALAVADRTA